MKNIFRFIFTVTLGLISANLLVAGECYIVLSPAQSGTRLRGRLYERGLASRSIDRETKAMLLKLPIKENEQSTEIGFQAKSDQEIKISVRGRYESGVLNTKKKYISFAYFSHLEANGKVLIGDAKGAKKPEMIYKDTPLSPSIKLKKGEKLVIKATFNEPSRQESRKLIRDLMAKEAAKEKK